MSDTKLPIYMKPNDWVRVYEKGIPHWAESQRPSSLAKQFLRMLPKKTGNKILEIGIGNGRDSVFFANQGNQVSGIDIAKVAINMAKNMAKTVGLEKKVNFKIGNAEKLKFENKSFDGVYSISVLHATDLNQSLKEISRVLKRDGKALLYLYEKTQEVGKEYWFMKREDIDKLLTLNHLTIKNYRKIIHRGHEKEKTTVLIYKLKKSPVTLF